MNGLAEQKLAYHTGDLDQGKIEILNELNVDWEISPKLSWDDYYCE